MKTEKLRFPGTHEALLSAYLDRPDNERAKAYALFAHCFTCSKNLKAVRNISMSLTQRDIGVMRFDFTGLGESEGDFTNTSFSSNVGDLIAAAEYMRERGIPPSILIGHSLGGAAALHAASLIESSKAVVTIAAPAEPYYVTRHFAERLDRIETDGEAEIILAGRTFTINRRFIEDLRAHRLNDAARKLNRALLILHSPIDATVDIQNAAEIFAAAKHPKSFIALDGADHLLVDEEDSQYVGAVIAAWSKRYV